MSNSYRPCEVNGKKGIFHEWVQSSRPIRANYYGDGAPSGQLTRTFGIIEYEDGSVSLEYPSDVKFTDLLAKGINFTDRKTDKLKRLEGN